VDKLFIQILNMSLTASYVILFVLLARLPLKRAPKIFSYALWGVVLFRLLCPFSFESIFSLIPSTETIPPQVITENTFRVASGISIVDTPVNEYFSGNYFEGITAAEGTMLNAALLASFIWLTGLAALLVYSVVSLLRLRARLIGSVKWQQNIYFADHIPTPFVLGLFRPKIYLPSALAAHERAYIILHEQTHIARRDHIIKCIAFLALAVHWFNPLAWLAYALCVKDMEMSCDERVLKRMDGDIRQSYSASLLNLSIGRRIITGTPLAFGEGDTKSRIKNVMRYQKPAFWIVMAAIIAVIAICAALLANPGKAEPTVTPDPSEITAAPSAFVPVEWRSHEIGWQWSGGANLLVPEIPGVSFSCDEYSLTAVPFAVDDADAHVIISGMPIWNVILADLTGDGVPEFCATVSMGSGIIDDHIIVYDYASAQTYMLENRMFYDYRLHLENGQLLVSQRHYGSADIRATGTLILTNGALSAVGIDRTIPSHSAEPTSSAEPRTIEDTLHEPFYQAILLLYAMDSGINSGLKYIAVDMANIPETAHAALEVALQEWVSDEQCELLLDSHQGLVAAGLITPITQGESPPSFSGFTEGILFSIYETELDSQTLTISIDKYRGPLAAVGTTFTFQFADGAWILTETGAVWMA